VNLDQSIERAKKSWEQLHTGDKPLIFIGSATCGKAAGVTELQAILDDELPKLGVDVELIPTGCIGMCYAEPLVDVKMPNQPRVSYSSVTPKKLRDILKSHVQEGQPLADFALGTFGEDTLDGIPKLFDLPTLKPQVRIALRNCGVIDPCSLEHYLAHDGYRGLQRALSVSPDEVVTEVVKSGLRGRGGGGFPTGLKWKFCRASKGADKYLICNADEGDPGAFMDRSLLEGDPHAVLEGMCIAAYAIGANHGYIYIRAEYPLAILRLKDALNQMRENNLLGDNIQGTNFSFDIKIKEGAGAFVCGEETALIASIEGERGMPRSRPPFPAVKGLFGQPSNINNVETLANVSSILREGADWFASFGTEKSKGTKTFALAGKINRSGLIEVPMGITLGKVVDEIGGGISGEGTFKAAQTGGPSGGCLPDKFLETPIDYDSLAKAGSIMGSGGLVVVDENTCMVDMARYFLTFTQSESCGKCTPCRIGTREMLTVLERITAGKGKESDIELLEELGESIQRASLCGLGQTAPNPALTTIKYFREEYLEHIFEHKCRAGVCKALIRFSVIEENCTGCTLCAKRCPVDAITGEKKKLHYIDQSKCTQCGVCKDSCRFKAILVE
jgi:NADH:ubiquinone oxidoreductase subunit F (NADH-binding)/(2Fe-2S) ferredoxin/NAD-dependent dihydropyrimidine dehydrogenase PreA subunit